MPFIHVQFGYDLKYVKHYKTGERAVFEAQKALKNLLDQGVIFNILVVTQRKGGMGTDAEDIRHIPILHSFRVSEGAKFVAGAQQAAIFAARAGFPVFA